jgi:RNA polymerase sigma-70 factor (ECF subfamily)
VTQLDVRNRDLRSREFVRLLAQHELRLAGYVHAMIPLWNDAEDVLQNTKVRLWDQFDQFEPGTDFAAWAFTVAGYMIRTYRKQQKRQRLCFSDDVLQRISQYTPATSLMEEDRVSALMACVQTLGGTSRRLLRLFYGERRDVKGIAWDLGQTTAATYQALSRIRRSLLGCVEKRLQRGEQG